MAMAIYVTKIKKEIYDSKGFLQNSSTETLDVFKSLKEAVDYMNEYPLVNEAPTEFDDPLEQHFWVSAKGRVSLSTVGTWSLNDINGNVVLCTEEFELV